MKIPGGGKHRQEDERTVRSEDDLLVQADGASDSPSHATETEAQLGSPLAASDDALDADALDDTGAGTPGEDGTGIEGDDVGANGEGVEDSDEVAADEVAADEGEVDEPPAVGKKAKAHSLSFLNINSERVRASWRANTLAKTALLAVVIYTLAAGSAYLLVMQPLSTRLHLVQEQKGLLHDYMAIQQASAAINSFREGLMTGDQRLTVMSEVKQMAERSGVKIVGDAELLLGRGVSGSFVEYPLRLRIRGTFHETGVFLSLLEGSPRFTLIEEIEIMSDADSRERDSEATVLLALAAWEG